MTHRIRCTVRNYAKESLPLDWTDQQISEAPSTLEPPLLMDMIICDARAYSIKFMATRKRFDNAEKLKQQLELEDAEALLELDNGQDQSHTNKLMDKVKTLSDTLHITSPNQLQRTRGSKKVYGKKKLRSRDPNKKLL